MAASITITRNKTLPNSSDKSDFHDLVDTATASISGIDQTDLGSGVGLVVRQATAPSDTDQIWVDTSVTPYVVRIHDGTEWIATGGYVVMTNKSGGQRTLGDVCVIDTVNDGAFTTTTLYGDPRHVVVVMETIDDNSDGVVATSGGRVTNLKVDSATAKGDWLATASTAGRASKSFVNCFATALASIGGSGTLSEALLNRNALSLLANASIPAAGTSGQLLQTLGSGSNSVWAGTEETAVTDSTQRTSTTSATYQDVTSESITYTSLGGFCWATYTCVLSGGGAAPICKIAMRDGIGTVLAEAVWNNNSTGTSADRLPVCLSFIGKIAAGSYTIKISFAGDGSAHTTRIENAEINSKLRVVHFG